MTDRLRDALIYQGRACADLGSPFMGRLMELLADRLQPGTPLTDRLFGWEGELGPRGASVPLRLAGALHALKLSGDPVLSAVYPPHTPSDDQLWDAIAQTLDLRAEDIDRFIDSPPQTNEVRRSTALLSAAHWLGARWPLPLTVSELGASAGLNLAFDRFAVQTPDGTLGSDTPVCTLSPEWRSKAPAGPAPRIAEARGCDINPLDPAADRLRLLAYLWPDQPDRLTITEAAIGAATAEVDRADAADWLEGRLASPSPGLHMIYHTVAWQYFPSEVRTRCTALIEAAGAQATEDAPLAWISMENDGALSGAALTARLWPGNTSHAPGRIDFHGRWIDWKAAPL